VYNKDQANGEGAKTAAESSKEMAKENDTGGKDAPYSVSSWSSLKRQRLDDSFNSMWCEKFDMLRSALKDDGPKLPSSAKFSPHYKRLRDLMKTQNLSFMTSSPLMHASSSR
jgi:hypothetical protein